MDIVFAYENWFTDVRVVVTVEFWLETHGTSNENGIIRNSSNVMRFTKIDQILDLSCTELEIVYVAIYTTITCNVIQHPRTINHLQASQDENIWRV